MCHINGRVDYHFIVSMEINNINQGKKILRILFSILIVFQVGIIAAYLINVGDDKLLIQTIRFVFTLTLILLTYRGSKKSRWILIGYLVFSALQGFERLTQENNHLMICLITLYTIVPIIILFSDSVSEFLAEQRLKNIR